jgi:hypothetical protein
MYSIEKNNVEFECYIGSDLPSSFMNAIIFKCRSKLIDKSYKPNWNDVRVVRAMLAMAAQALQNPTMTHVLFCTESCIPIATMDETIQVLQHGTSFVSAYGRDSSNTTRFDERT